MMKLRILFLVLLSVVSAAQDSDISKQALVNPIYLGGLKSYQGKTLTVYYAIGSRGALSNEDDQITIREVKKKVSYTIQSEEVQIPETAIVRDSAKVPYNIIVFVIHDGTNFSWINGNRTVPQGEVLSTNNLSLGVSSLNKIEVEALIQRQGLASGQPIRYSFGAARPQSALMDLFF